MYEIVRNVITAGRYELADILTKIDTLWVQGSLTDSQHTELVTLARDNADPTNSYAGLQRQVDTLYTNMAEMAAQIKANADAITVLQGGTVEPPITEEYPPYVQPTGAHDAYNTGDKVTYNGQRYTCQMDGCVWDPDTYPAAWQLVEETPEVTA